MCVNSEFFLPSVSHSPDCFGDKLLCCVCQCEWPALFLNGVNSHFGTLCTTSRYSKEETMSALFLPSKIPCSASTQRRGNFGKESVMIGVVHLKNVNDAFSSGYVNTFVFSVIVKIVWVFGTRKSRNHPTRCRVEHSHTRWFAYSYE